MPPKINALPAAKLVEERVDRRIADAEETVRRARALVAEARKLVHKTHAVRDQARTLRAKRQG